MKKRYGIRQSVAALVIAALLFEALPVGALVSSDRKTRALPSYCVSEILVKYKDGTNREQVRKKIRSLRIFRKFRVSNLLKDERYAVVDVGRPEDLIQELENISAMPEVEYAAPNYLLTGYTAQSAADWGENNDLGFAQARELTGGSAAAVGVLDTGIDIAHPALQNSLCINAGEIPYNGLDDDGNGYIDDVCGWDFVNRDAGVYDGAQEDEHGTAVAGVLADKGVRVLPLKFMKNGVGRTSDAIEAIAYAQSQGIRILNCSFGCTEFNYALKEAMGEADILFVCAAGNAELGMKKSYPASFGLPNILSVGAVDAQEEAGGLNANGEKIDVYAPGVGICTILPESGRDSRSGTSLATPFVSAAAAYIFQAAPALGVRMARAALLGGVDGSRVLDAAQAVRQALPYSLLSSDAPALEALIGQAPSSLSPAAAEILRKNRPAAQLSAEQKDLLNEAFSLPQGSWVVPVRENWPLYDGLFLMVMAGSCELPWVGLQALYEALPGAYTEVLSAFGSYCKNLPVSAADKSVILRLLAEDYAPDAVMRSWLAAQAFGLPLEGLAARRLWESQNLPYSEEESRQFVNITQLYYLDTAVFQRYLNSSGLLPSQAAERLGAWMREHQISLQDGEVTAYYAEGTYLSKGYSKYLADDNEPWSYHGVSVGKLTGELSYSKSLISVPNSTLELAIRYDPEVNSVDNTAKDPDQLPETLTGSERRQYYKRINGSWVRDEDMDTWLSHTLTWDNLETLISLNGTEVQVDSNTKYIRSIRAQSYIKTGSAVTSTTENFYQSRYGLGIGWAMNLSTIEDGRYLHLANGEKYRIVYQNGSYVIHGLNVPTCTLRRVGLTPGDEESFSIGGIAVYNCLSYLDGSREYFDMSGRQIGMKDAYGNLTQIAYSNGLISRMTDPAGRWLEFSWSNPTANQKQLQLILHPSTGGASQLMATVNMSKYGEDYLLSSVTDPMFRTESYTYQEDSADVTINRFAIVQIPVAQTSVVSVDHINLKSITLAEGASIQATYETGWKMYGMSSTQNYQRVSGLSMKNGAESKQPVSFLYQLEASTATGDTPPTGQITLMFWRCGQDAFVPHTYRFYGSNSLFDGGQREIFVFDADYQEVRTDTYDVSGVSPIRMNSRQIIERSANGLPRKVQEITYSPTDSSNYFIRQTLTNPDAYGNATVDFTDYYVYKHGIQMEAYEQSRVVYAFDYSISKTHPIRSKNMGAGEYIMTRNTIEKERLVSQTTYKIYYEKPNNMVTALKQSLWQYDDAGRLVREKKYTFTGDEHYGGNLDYFESTSPTAITNDIIIPNSSNASYAALKPLETTYSYDGYDNPAIITQKNIQDADGNLYDVRTRADYNYLGQEIVSYTPAKVSNGQLLPGETEWATIHTFNAAGEPLTSVSPYGAAAETVYDHANRKVTQKAPGQPDSVSISNEYGLESHTYQQAYSNGVLNPMPRHQVSRSYNDRLQLGRSDTYTSTMNGEYISTKYSYAWDGSIKEKIVVPTRRGEELSAQKTIETTTVEPVALCADGSLATITTVAVTDNAGNLLSKSVVYTDALGNEIRRDTYDGTANAYTDTSTVNASGIITATGGETLVDESYYYDYARRNNNVISGNPGGDGGLVETAQEFDGDSQVIRQGYANNYQTNGTISDDKAVLTDYDNLGRIIRVSTPFQRSGDTLYYAKTKTFYDARGNVCKEQRLINSLDEADKWATTLYSYDAENRLSMVTQNDGARNLYTQYVYDAAGRKTAQFTGLTSPLTISIDYSATPFYTVTPGTDTVYSVTTYAYDEMGNFIKLTGPEGKTERYAYDEAGQMVSKTLGNGTTTSYTYDIRGNVLSMTAGSLAHTFTYDSDNKKASATDEHGTTWYTYDLLGRTLSEIRVENGRIISMNHYTYDGENRLSYALYVCDLPAPTGQPTVSQVLTAYEADASLRRQALIYQYDAQGRLSRVDDTVSGAYVGYTYNEDGTVARKISGKTGATEQTQSFVYNLAGLIRGENAPGQSSTRTYRLDGNLTQAYPESSRLKKYTYDDMGRLIREEQDYQYEIDYAFDDLGNREKKVQLTKTYSSSGWVLETVRTTYSYDAAGKLTRETDATLNGGVYEPGDQTAYTYDDAGNLSNVSVNGTVKDRYTYDSLNRLAGAETYTLAKLPDLMNGGGLTTEQVQEQAVAFAYNADAKRTGKTVTLTGTQSGAAVTKTAAMRQYSNGTSIVLDEVKQDGAVTKRNSYLFGRETAAGYYQFEALYDGAQVYTAVSDPHLDITNLVNTDTDKVTDHYAYDAYGNELAATSSGLYNPYRYTGQYLDAETGLYYLRARYYDPAAGRFTQEDSYLGEERNPLTLNLYGYCYGNPIIFYDPNGNKELNVWDYLPFPGMIHEAIQKEIAYRSYGSIYMEYTIPGTNRRIDLYNWRTKEIYEVKPFGSEWVGLLQLGMYTLSMQMAGQPTILGHSIKYKSFFFEIFLVEVYGTPNGLLLYKFKINPLLSSSAITAYLYKYPQVKRKVESYNNSYSYSIGHKFGEYGKKGYGSYGKYDFGGNSTTIGYSLAPFILWGSLSWTYVF